MLDTERYLEIVAKVNIDDLDWEAARRAGLNERERRLLRFFADIESQTIVYTRDFLLTKAALEPDIAAFLTTWQYEEFFHGRALSRLLQECGYQQSENRIAEVREKAGLKETIEVIGYATLSRIFDKAFPALYMTWGAIQENLTVHGYEELCRTSANPVLRELAGRIAKQERRHFAWYYNKARERLNGSAMARRFTRFMLVNFWTPVGTGAVGAAAVRELVDVLLPGDRKFAVADEIDAKIAALPGMDGLKPVRGYMEGGHSWLSVWSFVDRGKGSPLVADEPIEFPPAQAA